MDAQLQADLNRVVTALRKMEPFVRKSGKADLIEAAKILSTAVVIRTPVGDKVHRRYPKRVGARARKGTGKVLATYKPGNLKKSMGILNFRRSNAAFVGAKLGRKTFDGYYSAAVRANSKNVDGTSRQGNDYVKAAVSAVGGATLRKAVQLIGKRIQSYGSTNGFR